MAREILSAVQRGGFRFGDLTVEELASLVDTSKATFYVYFSDKHEVAKVCLTEVVLFLTTENRGWHMITPGSTREELREFLARLVHGYVPNSGVMAAVYDLALYDREIGDAIDELVSSLVKKLAAHIRAGQRVGLVDPELPPTETAEWLTWMAEQSQHALTPALPAAELERHIDAYTDIVWNTLYGAAPVRSSPS